MSLAPRARRQTVVTHRPASGSNVVKLTTEDGHPNPATFNSKLELCTLQLRDQWVQCTQHCTVLHSKPHENQRMAWPARALQKSPRQCFLQHRQSGK